MEEKEYWQGLLNQRICVQKQLSNNNDFYYNGTISEVFEDKLIFNDDKIGKTLLCFKGLSLISKKEGYNGY